MRSPITGLVTQFQSLTPEEQKVFLDLVDPHPEQEQTKVKRTRKKKTEASAPQKRGLPTGAANSDVLCTAQVPGLDVLCGEKEDALIHDPKGGYASYHPFVRPASTAGKRSSRKGAGTSPTLNTGTDTGNDLAAGASGD